MAKDLNHVIVIGRLVRPPEIKYTPKGIPVTKFSIANNADFTQGNELKKLTNFFDVTVWGNQAINCEKYLKKGNQVAIQGSLRQNTWVDQATGKNQSKIEIVADSVQFLTPPSGGQPGGSSSEGNYQNYSANNNNASTYSGTGNYNKPQNNANTQPPPKDFIPNPWNDSYDNNSYEEPFSDGSGNPDDDIPF